MDKEVKALLEQIAANTTTANERSAAATKAVEEFNTKQDARFTALEGRLATIEKGKSVKRRAVQRGVVSVPGLEDEIDKFSWARAIGCINSGIWEGFEKEVFESSAKASRTLNQSTNTQGGFLVPAELQDGIIEALTKRATVIRAGATWIQGLAGGNLEFNREDAVVDLAAQAETLTSAMTDSTPTLSQLVLSEHSAGALVYITEQMVRNANTGVDAWIERQLVKAIARYIDKMALVGTGASNQPLGIMNDTDLQTLALSNTPLEFDDLAEMQTMLEETDAWDDAGKMAMIWHPRVRNALRRQRLVQYSGQTGGGGFVFGAKLNNLSDVLGFPEFGSTQLSGVSGSADAILGNWEELIIASWGNMVIKRSDDYRFGLNQIAIRAVIGMDIGVRHDDSFVTVTDASTTPA